jgi:hypothetical protein
MTEGDSGLKVPDEYARIGRLKRRHEKALLAKANVVGVAVGNKYTGGEDTGTPCIVVKVSVKLPQDELDDEDIVPATLDDVPTDVDESGFFHPLAFNSRLRPAPGGASISHRNGGIGTLGTGCLDEEDAEVGIPRRYYLLSCNHVLANTNRASPGDAILQPGAGDGGTFPADVVGSLDRFVPIQFGTQTGPTTFTFPVNYADAAIARCDLDRVNREIQWIGYPRHSAPGNPFFSYGPGTRVQKTGRTSEFTVGRITQVFGSIVIPFPNAPVTGTQIPQALFGDVIVTTSMSQGGDSGSIACDIDYAIALGMVFAGSRRETLLNPIYYVESLLGVSIAVDPA